MLLVEETMRDTIDVEVEMVSAWAARNDLALNKSRGGRWWSRGGVVLFFLCHCCLMQRVWLQWESWVLYWVKTWIRACFHVKQILQTCPLHAVKVLRTHGLPDTLGNQRLQWLGCCIRRSMLDTGWVMPRRMIVIVFIALYPACREPAATSQRTRTIFVRERYKGGSLGCRLERSPPSKQHFSQSSGVHNTLTSDLGRTIFFDPLKTKETNFFNLAVCVRYFLPLVFTVNL